MNFYSSLGRSHTPLWQSFLVYLVYFVVSKIHMQSCAAVVTGMWVKKCDEGNRGGFSHVEMKCAIMIGIIFRDG